MRELVEGKNTIGRTAAVLKSPIKRPLPYLYLCVYLKGNYLRTNLLTPWSRVLLEKLTGSAASQEISPNFMKHEVSLPHSQVPAICPYPEPARSSP